MMFGNSLPQQPNYQTDHNFSKTPHVDIPRSRMNRSSDLKTTFDSGYLVPIFVDEVLPGDTFQMNYTGVARLSTMLYPIMDSLYLDMFFFQVPLRILQDNFVKIHGEQTNPNDSIDYLSPKINLTGVGGVEEGSLYDYFGYPTGEVYGSDPTECPNNYAGRAYNQIWAEWFRDQNLQDSPVIDKDDGFDDYADYTLLKRGKRHDYFTSCLPWPQKGDAVSMPLGDTAPIELSGTSYAIVTDLSGTPISGTGALGNAFDGTLDNTAGTPRLIDPNGSTVANLAEATSASINSIRLAFQTQKVLEKDARGGTRYIEHIKSHFGVTSPDSRLQRPELLALTTSRINISEVPQTSSTDGTSPQGNLSAIGTVVANVNFTESFTEHGIIIGLACLRADLSYQQGLPRMFSRSSRYDWYLPSLAHIGEQAVLNKEIYAQGTSDDNDVFGYQERWAEYRYKPSLITGKMRSNATGSLDAWHLAIDEPSLPTLSAGWIEEQPPIDRIVAVNTEPDLIFNGYSTLYCTRPMPIYSVPGLIDHF